MFNNIRSNFVVFAIRIDLSYILNMYRLSNRQSVVMEMQERQDVLVFPDNTRVYLITGLFYYSSEIEMLFPFNLYLD